MAVIEVKMTVVRKFEVINSKYPGHSLQDIIDHEVKLAIEEPEMFIYLSNIQVGVTGKLVEGEE